MGFFGGISHGFSLQWTDRSLRKLPCEPVTKPTQLDGTGIMVRSLEAMEGWKKSCKLREKLITYYVYVLYIYIIYIYIHTYIHTYSMDMMDHWRWITMVSLWDRYGIILASYWNLIFQVWRLDSKKWRPSQGSPSSCSSETCTGPTRWARTCNCEANGHHNGHIDNHYDLYYGDVSIIAIVCHCNL